MANENNNSLHSEDSYLNVEGYNSYVMRRSEDTASHYLSQYLKERIIPTISSRKYAKCLRLMNPSSDIELRDEIINNIDVCLLSQRITQKLTGFGISKHPIVLNSVGRCCCLKYKLLNDDHFYNRVFTTSFTTVDVWLTSH